MQRSEFVNLLFQPSLDFGAVFKEIASHADAVIAWFSELQEYTSQESNIKMLIPKTPADFQRKKRFRISTIQEQDETASSPQESVQSSQCGLTAYRSGRTAAMAASIKIKTISSERLNDKLRRPSNSMNASTANLTCSTFDEDEPLAKMMRLDVNKESRRTVEKRESKCVPEIAEIKGKTRGRLRKGKASNLSIISISSDRSMSIFSSGKQSEVQNMDTSDFPTNMSNKISEDKDKESQQSQKNSSPALVSTSKSNSAQPYELVSDVEIIPRKQSLRGSHNLSEAKKSAEESAQKVNSAVEVDENMPIQNVHCNTKQSSTDNNSNTSHISSLEKQLQKSYVNSNGEKEKNLVQTSLIPNSQQCPIILLDKISSINEEAPSIKDKMLVTSSDTNKLESSGKRTQNVKPIGGEKELKVLLFRASPQILQNKSSPLQQNLSIQNISSKYSNEENAIPEIPVFKNINSSFRSNPDVLADISNRITPINNSSNDKGLEINEETIWKKKQIIKDCKVTLSHSLISKYLPDMAPSLKQNKFLKKSPVVFSPYTKETVKTKVAAYEKLKTDPVEEEETTVQPPPSGRVTRTKTRALKAAAAIANDTSNVENDSTKREKVLLNTLLRKSLSKAKTTLNNKSRTDIILSTERQKVEQQSSSKYVNVLTTIDTFLPKITANTSITDDLKKKEEELKRRAEKEAEAKRKREERLQQVKLEKKRKWEEKMQKVHVTQENFEKQRMVKKRLIEEKDEKAKLALMERGEKLREETQKKKMYAQLKGLEIEERRKQEEAARLAKLKEQEEEQAALNVTRKKEQLEVEKKRAQEEKEAQALKMQVKKNTTAKKKIGKDMNQVYENAGGLNATYNVNDSIMDYGLDDTNDSTDDESAPKRTVPNWVNRIDKRQYEAAECLPKAALRAFVFVDNNTPDLKQFFKKTDPRWERRNSSAIWDTPPRYSQLPKF